MGPEANARHRSVINMRACVLFIACLALATAFDDTIVPEHESALQYDDSLLFDQQEEAPASNLAANGQNAAAKSGYWRHRVRWHRGFTNHIRRQERATKHVAKRAEKVAKKKKFAKKIERHTKWIRNRWGAPASNLAASGPNAAAKSGHHLWHCSTRICRKHREKFVKHRKKVTKAIKKTKKKAKGWGKKFKKFAKKKGAPASNLAAAKTGWHRWRPSIKAHFKRVSNAAKKMKQRVERAAKRAAKRAKAAANKHWTRAKKIRQRAERAAKRAHKGVKHAARRAERAVKKHRKKVVKAIKKTKKKAKGWGKKYKKLAKKVKGGWGRF